MSDEGVASSQRRVLGLRLRVWLIFFVAFLVGFVIGAVLWAIVMQSRLHWNWSGWPTIIALITLGGILVTALATVALAASTRALAQSAQDQTKATNQELEVIRGQLQVAKEQAAHIHNVSDLAVFVKATVVAFVGVMGVVWIMDAVKTRLSRRRRN